MPPTCKTGLLVATDRPFETTRGSPRSRETEMKVAISVFSKSVVVVFSRGGIRLLKSYNSSNMSGFGDGTGGVLPNLNVGGVP